MLRKYHIALTPIKNTEQFIQYGETISSSIEVDKYLIGDKSIPHITLCHFQANENQIKNIWEQVKKLNIKTIELTFDKRRSKEYAKHPKWKGVYWVSFIPDHIAALKEMHLAITKIIKPTNASFDKYDPHMTILNSSDEDQCNKINDSIQMNPPLKERFHIILGLRDDAGQLTQILYD